MTFRTIDLLLLRFALLLLLSLVSVELLSAEESSSTASDLSDLEIKIMLRDYIDSDKLGVGLAVGVVHDHGRQVISHGKLGNGTDGDVDGDTLFHIGSITKVFTALLLQDMVERGEMKLNDPVQEYLPDSARLPTFQGKEITLLHLATHTSGLPRDANGQLYAFLTSCKLQQSPGTRREYSNLGVGLLGHVIALKAGKDYETLVIERICQPLGMDDTHITVPPELKSRLAMGHAMPGYRVQTFAPPHREVDARAPNLLGAGSIRSTANDLLKFVSAYLGLNPSPLSSVMQRARAFHSLESGDKRPLAWESDGTFFEHGGLTKGYQAELAFDVKKRRGIVVMSNCSNFGTFVPGVWRSLLDGRSPKPVDFVLIDPVLYDQYMGQYKLEGPSQLCSVRREGKRLLLQWIGQPGQRVRLPSFEVFPQSESVFRNEFREVQAKFLLTTNGQPSRLVLTSLGPNSGFEGAIELTRISTDIPAPPVAVHVDPGIYDRYVGQYRKTFLFGLIRVGPTLTITHEKDEVGNHLIAYVRGLGREEIFPKSETDFILGSTIGDDVQINFDRKRNGKTTGVVVHWNGKNLRGTRISTKAAN